MTKWYWPALLKKKLTNFFPINISSVLYVYILSALQALFTSLYMMWQQWGGRKVKATLPEILRFKMEIDPSWCGMTFYLSLFTTSNGSNPLDAQYQMGYDNMSQWPR